VAIAIVTDGNGSVLLSGFGAVIGDTAAEFAPSAGSMNAGGVPDVATVDLGIVAEPGVVAKRFGNLTQRK
jgi:hypothetical protein